MNNRYLRRDLLSVAEKVEAFQADIKEAKPGAEEEFEDYQTFMKKRVDECTEVRILYQSVISHYSEQRSSKPSYAHFGPMVCMTSSMTNLIRGWRLLTIGIISHSTMILDMS